MTKFDATMNHSTLEQLELGMKSVLCSPDDRGSLEAIVIRPAKGQRVSLTECELSDAGGVHGDRWMDGCWMTLEDGRPHPDVQICIMNSRMIDLVAGERERWQLSGDNLYFDLNLGHDNLSTGQRLKVGSVIMEITAVPHNACGQFRERYGAAAAKFINSNEGRNQRLRGIYAKVIEAGVVAVGDEILKC